ncbi:microtubule associated protein [Coccidioides immitis RS]|uniref:Microtubule associated protein n=1 Tax=Coccidioides immitis (strain RS) TaxID=246410 RepID=J3K2I6_COCIM|nr:microtubule associated protein [Coccidioides immitis RS]EAS28303.3 microtubule associated protein [Coccidioides immitis RS]
MTVDTSYLTTQVNNIVEQLHGLFDEIGVPNHERDSRESELFAALSETLNGHLQGVHNEKNDMIEEANRLITTIKQMQASLDDGAYGSRRASDDPDLRVTLPLNHCLALLREKQHAVGKRHQERFEQVKKLVEALESYSSHLESTFVKIPLPPTAPGTIVPPSFDLSAAYVNALDNEFTRVYEEYNRRLVTVSTVCEEIIKLWAELGTPQAQTDPAIVEHHRDSPEQLGLHESDLASLRTKRDKLLNEKKAREGKIKELRTAVEALWGRLGVEESDRKGFLAANRGCGLRTINEFEEELARLNELKRQNLHLFVEDARCRLQELWDSLYYSEEEMLDFTPAFSDVYSDALLSAHEAEIARLEALKEQRMPVLQLIDKHRSLVEDRDALAASSQDASRLMGRGTGQRRDPTRLLREEKMRKRISKELPKVEVELRKILETWEDEYGRPFLVHGERYLDELGPPPQKIPPRSKTPCPSVSRPVSRAAPSRAGGTIRGQQNPSSAAKTPTGNGTLKRNAVGTGSLRSGTNPRPKSPTKIPARVPLANMPDGSNSPDRQPAQSYSTSTFRGKMGPPRAPPPKMRELFSREETPQATYQTGLSRSRSVMSSTSSGKVRPVSPEDVYDDRQRSFMSSSMSHYRPISDQSFTSSYISSREDVSFCNQQPKSYANQFQQQYQAQSPPPRQISNSSTINTLASGSENWETYDDASEPEVDATEAYYAKVRAAQGKRAGAEAQLGYPNKPKSIRGVGSDDACVQSSFHSKRLGGSDDWTDDLETY